MTQKTRSDINRGDFPAVHDSVLIVRHSNGRQYFTGESYELAKISCEFLKLSCVRSVEIVPVDKFEL